MKGRGVLPEDQDQKLRPFKVIIISERVGESIQNTMTETRPVPSKIYKIITTKGMIMELFAIPHFSFVLVIG